MKASISYFPNESKKSKKTGKIPLYARICLNGTKAEERLSAEFTETELLFWNPMVMRFSDRSVFANSVLNSLDQKFQEFIILNATGLSGFTARMIMDHVMGKNKVMEITVLDFVNDYFEKSILKNSRITHGTIRNYKKSINHLKAFLEYRKTNHLFVSQLNNDFAIAFMEYLQSDVPKYSKKAMTEVSAAFIIKKFRTIFDRAVDKEILSKNPFKTVKIRTISPRRERLSIYQVKQLYDLDFSNTPLQKIYRDVFLFSVFTGLANIDSRELKKFHLHERTDGNIKLSVKRAKTDVVTESFLVSYAIDIVKRYQSTPEYHIQGYVLPHRSNKELNVQLKIIAVMANIPINLTSHVARHTFRQLLAEAGIEDMGVIKRVMGHSRSSEIDNVYYVITESRLLNVKSRFEKYLTEYLK